MGQCNKLGWLYHRDLQELLVEHERTRQPYKTCCQEAQKTHPTQKVSKYQESFVHSFYYSFSLVSTLWKQSRSQKLTNTIKTYSSTKVIKLTWEEPFSPPGRLCICSCCVGTNTSGDRTGTVAQFIPQEGHILIHNREHAALLSSGVDLAGTAQGRGSVSSSGYPQVLCLVRAETMQKAPTIKCKTRCPPNASDSYCLRKSAGSYTAPQVQSSWLQLWIITYSLI